MGCCPWGRTESDLIEATQQQQQRTLSKRVEEADHRGFHKPWENFGFLVFCFFFFSMIREASKEL